MPGVPMIRPSPLEGEGAHAKHGRVRVWTTGVGAGVDTLFPVFSPWGRGAYASSSNVTATSALALRRILSPSISAIRPFEI